MISLDKIPIVSCDLETTGTDVNGGDCWITGSFGILDPYTLQTVKELEVRSRPYIWKEEARRIHRISRHTAAEFPPREEALAQIINFIPKNREFYFLCHARFQSFDKLAKQSIHAHFDLAFIKEDFTHQKRRYDFFKHFDESRAISTHTMARDIGLKARTLEDLCSFFGVEYGEHRAKGDRLSLEEVFRRMINYESNPFFI